VKTDADGVEPVPSWRRTRVQPPFIDTIGAFSCAPAVPWTMTFPPSIFTLPPGPLSRMPVSSTSIEYRPFGLLKLPVNVPAAPAGPVAP
jgi:hypothetical protein